MGEQGRIVRALTLVGALLAGLVATAASAQEDHSYYGPRLVEEKVRIPTPNGRSIAATVLRPDAQGPFGAGRGGDRELKPGVLCAIEPVARVFDSIGKNIRVPVLFHYAENDLFFSPKVSRGWFERFNANGANAEYALQPAFGKDGHYLFGDTLGVRYWLPTVEGFLGKHGVQFARLDSADPERQPLLALDRVPNIKSDACKGLYRAFLESPGPRAYAVSADWRCGFAGGLN